MDAFALPAPQRAQTNLPDPHRTSTMIAAMTEIVGLATDHGICRTHLVVGFGEFSTSDLRLYLAATELSELDRYVDFAEMVAEVCADELATRRTELAAIVQLGTELHTREATESVAIGMFPLSFRIVAAIERHYALEPDGDDLYARTRDEAFKQSVPGRIRDALDHVRRAGDDASKGRRVKQRRLEAAQSFLGAIVKWMHARLGGGL